MSVRHLLSAEAAHLLAQPAATSTYTVTAGRLWSLVAAVVGLAGVALGVLALVRPAARTGIRSAIVSSAAGLIAVVLGGLVVAAAEGGPGTGYGIVGGVIAVVIGLIAVVLGGLALIRYRRIAAPAVGDDVDRGRPDARHSGDRR